MRCDFGYFISFDITSLYKAELYRYKAHADYMVWLSPGLDPLRVTLLHIEASYHETNHNERSIVMLAVTVKTTSDDDKMRKERKKEREVNTRKGIIINNACKSNVSNHVIYYRIVACIYIHPFCSLPRALP